MNQYHTNISYRSSSDCQILFGGKCDDSVGYFIQPTVIQTKNPKDKLMTEEIFGPVLTVYVYEDGDYQKTLKLCDDSPFALTGNFALFFYCYTRIIILILLR